MKTSEIKRRVMDVPPPVDTTTSQHDPGWTRGRNPRAIERQEKEGQQQLVNNQQLPTRCPADLKAELEAAGVVFGAVTPGDALFCMAQLPKGWKKEGSDDHSMWSYLVDDKGVKRAAIFYKAAYYDRDAFLSRL